MALVPGPGCEPFALSLCHIYRCCNEVLTCKQAAQRMARGTQARETAWSERDGDVGGMGWDWPRGVNRTGVGIRAAPGNF